VIDGGVAAGTGVAIAAAGCYEAAYVLQALEARGADRDRALRPGLLAQLARRPRWLGGTALSVLGAGLQVAALSLAPLTVVQPTLALGLLVLLYLGRRVLGESVGRRELAAALVLVAGVAAIVAAAPARSDAVTSTVGLAVALVALAAAAAAPYGLRAAGRPVRGEVLVLGAGCGDACAALAAKLVADALGRGAWVAAAVFAAMAAAFGLTALTSEMTALQRLPATRVAPVILVLGVIAPVALAPLVFGERWGATPLAAVGLGGGLALVAAATWALGRSVAVADVLGAGAVGEREALEDH
jgi:drug/metabolite transporter (DMT)-like permease